LVSDDVLEDPVVGGGCAPDAVLWLQAVNRDDDRESAQAVPRGRDLTDGTRHELGVDAAGREPRQQLVELAVAHDGLAAHDREVQRAMLVDKRHDAVDEGLALEVADLAQRDVAAEMVVAVRVATGAMERALSSDFNRECWHVPCEDPSPRRED